MTLSRHPGSLPVLHRFTSVRVRLAMPLRSIRSPTFHRRRSLRARSPFTRAVAFFGALRASLFETEHRLVTSATAFTATYGHCDPSSRTSLGRRPRSPSGSDASRTTFLAEAVTRGEPRFVRSCRPRCRFLSLARVYPTAIPTRTRHLRCLATPKCSDDRRARIRGPSEGRVP